MNSPRSRRGSQPPISPTSDDHRDAWCSIFSESYSPASLCRCITPAESIVQPSTPVTGNLYNTPAGFVVPDTRYTSPELAFNAVDNTAADGQKTVKPQEWHSSLDAAGSVKDIDTVFDPLGVLFDRDIPIGPHTEAPPQPVESVSQVHNNHDKPSTLEDDLFYLFDDNDFNRSVTSILYYPNRVSELATPTRFPWTLEERAIMATSRSFFSRISTDEATTGTKAPLPKHPITHSEVRLADIDMTFNTQDLSLSDEAALRVHPRGPCISLSSLPFVAGSAEASCSAKPQETSGAAASAVNGDAVANEQETKKSRKSDAMEDVSDAPGTPRKRAKKEKTETNSKKPKDPKEPKKPKALKILTPEQQAVIDLLNKTAPLFDSTEVANNGFIYHCPVIGCEGRFRNMNGYKYHKDHGHLKHSLLAVGEGRLAIQNPLTGLPYEGAEGVQQQKPYKCRCCHKRYKNPNGLKYHYGHSPACSPPESNPSETNPSETISSEINPVEAITVDSNPLQSVPLTNVAV